MVEDDDDLGMEEWMEMTDEQQEAMLVRLNEEAAEAAAQWAARTPLIEQYRYYRARRLKNLLRWRSLIRRMPMGEFGIEHLKQLQIGLLKLRTFLETGHYPTDA